MAHALLLVTVVLSSINCIVSDEITAKYVYDVLSSRINGLYIDIQFIRNDMGEMKARVEEVSELVKGFDEVQGMEFNKENHKDGQNVNEDNDVEIDIRTHVSVVRKTLASEKRYFRIMEEKFESKIKTFEQAMKQDEQEMMTKLTDLANNTNSSKMEIVSLQRKADATDQMIIDAMANVEEKQLKADATDQMIIDAMANMEEKQLKADATDQTIIDAMANMEEKQLLSLNKHEERILTRLKGIEHDVDSVKQHVSLIQQHADKRKVSFSAYLKNSLMDLAVGSKVMFDGVVHNNGQGFDSKTGIFTCPENGTYLFVFTVMSHKSEHGLITLHTDKGTKLSAYAIGKIGGDTISTQATGSVISNLFQNDRVWMQTSVGVQSLFKHYTTFTGTMLY